MSPAPCRAHPATASRPRPFPPGCRSCPGWTRYQVALKPSADPGALLEACTAQSFALRSFDIHRPALHEVFIHLVGGGSEGDHGIVAQEIVP